MEAFALAKVAEQEGIDFLCLKYISDGADGNAADDWTLEVKKASIALRRALDKL
jgi:adenosylhomocysteine nucleosidase